MVSFNASNPSEGTEYYDIPIENEPELTEKGFKKFSLPTNGNATKMVLDNEKDRELKTYVSFNRHDSIEVASSLLKLKLLEENKITRETIDILITYFENAARELANDPDVIFFKPKNGNGNGNAKGNGNGKSKNKKSKSKQKKQTSTTSSKTKTDEEDEENEPEKITSRSQIYKLGNHLLAEAVLIGEHNQPYWIVYDSVTGLISVHEFLSIIHEDGQNKLLYAPRKSAYLNEPYVFESIDKINQLIEEVKSIETPDTLFTRIKRQWKKYVNESDNHISICSGDCVFTYYQDRLGTTHYLFFVADTEAGKTTNLQLFQKIAYRAFLGLDITTANIYRFYGNEYEGIGTLLEDEVDSLDEESYKLKMYKSGYTKGVKVPKSEKPSDSEGFEQEGYYTYGFKAFTAERMPSSFRAKGFKDRIVKMSCSFGLPEIDLHDVLDNGDDPRYKPLLAELDDLRNRLLIYRILHYFDPINIIDTKLQAREKQLWNPLLRVFQNTQTYSTLRQVAIEFIKESREQKSHTHTAFLLNLIIELQLENKGSLTFPTSEIWTKYKDLLPEGQETGRTSYTSAEFGDMSQKRLIEILADQFKARPPKHHGEKRQLVFDKTILDRMKQKYRINLDNNVGTDGTDGTDITGYIQGSEENSGDNSSENIEEDANNSEKTEETNTNSTEQNNHQPPYTPSNVSHVSHVSQTQKQDEGQSHDPDSYWKHGKWRENI